MHKIIAKLTLIGRGELILIVIRSLCLNSFMMMMESLNHVDGKKKEHQHKRAQLIAFLKDM